MKPRMTVAHHGDPEEEANASKYAGVDAARSFSSCAYVSWTAPASTSSCS